MFIFIIKEAREEKGITQEELASKVGISRSYLARIENNKAKNISFNIIDKIAEELNTGIEKIYVPVRNIETLKRVLYKSIDETGINSSETLKISHLIDKLTNLKMEIDGIK